MIRGLSGRHRARRGRVRSRVEGLCLAALVAACNTPISGPTTMPPTSPPMQAGTPDLDALQGAWRVHLFEGRDVDIACLTVSGSQVSSWTPNCTGDAATIVSSSVAVTSDGAGDIRVTIQTPGGQFAYTFVLVLQQDGSFAGTLSTRNLTTGEVALDNLQLLR